MVKKEKSVVEKHQREDKKNHELEILRMSKDTWSEEEPRWVCILCYLLMLRKKILNQTLKSRRESAVEFSGLYVKLVEKGLNQGDI